MADDVRFQRAVSEPASRETWKLWIRVAVRAGPAAGARRCLCKAVDRRPVRAIPEVFSVRSEVVFNGPCRARTCDRRIMSPLL